MIRIDKDHKVKLIKIPKKSSQRTKNKIDKNPKIESIINLTCQLVKKTKKQTAVTSYGKIP